MRISDWSSDVCSSDLSRPATPAPTGRRPRSPGASEEERSARTARQRTLLAPVPPGILSAQLLSGERLELSLRQRCQTGRASGRERVCHYVEFSVVAVPLNKE